MPPNRVLVIGALLVAPWPSPVLRFVCGREQKKMLKCMFKEEKLNQRWELQNAESQKSKMSLGGGISTL